MSKGDFEAQGGAILSLCAECMVIVTNQVKECPNCGSGVFERAGRIECHVSWEDYEKAEQTGLLDG